MIDTFLVVLEVGASHAAMQHYLVLEVGAPYGPSGDLLPEFRAPHAAPHDSRLGEVPC